MDDMRLPICITLQHQLRNQDLLLVILQQLLGVNNTQHSSVFKRIFILDQIEYRILFALAKLTESNNEYYSCCEIYSNNIRIVQDIRIFEYFRIIFNAKMKDLLKYQKTLCFVKMPSVLTIIRPKLNYHSFCFLLNKYLFN